MTGIAGCSALISSDDEGQEDAERDDEVADNGEAEDEETSPEETDFDEPEAVVDAYMESIIEITETRRAVFHSAVPQDIGTLEYEIVDIDEDVEFDDLDSARGLNMDALEDEISDEELAIAEVDAEEDSRETIRMGLATENGEWQIVAVDLPSEDQGGSEDGSEESAGEIEPDDDIPDEVHEYLMEHETQEYDGTLVDEVGSDSVRIDVGGGNAGLAFTPPVVRIDAGTEVTWEWTGSGGAHNVESTEGPVEFSSEDIVDSAEKTWSRTFEETGNHFYFCAPHAGVGMYGAIIVE